LREIPCEWAAPPAGALNSFNFPADETDMTPSAFGIDVLGRVMDAAALRHKVIAQNVANVNTPGYRRLAVEFEDELAKALGTPGGAGRVTPKVVIADGPERVDGNTVDMDREMGDLTKNGLLYQAAAQIIASRMAALRSAVSGR
jgi:flagellar basal-body rod protein FlgB